MTRFRHSLALSTLLASSLALVACGGGGGSTARSTPPPVAAVAPPPPPPAPAPTTTSEAPTFTMGVFESSNRFEAMCENPRSGNDPDGNPFPDSAGSTLLEKFWLRSWSDETYLWNDEIADTDPNSIADRVPYFDILKSNELSETGSMREKDDFHFSEPTEEFFARRNSAASSGYGFRLTSVGPRDEQGRSIIPRDFRILFTEPNSPASAITDGNVNFPRGTRILSVDGADLVNGNDTTTLNNGLFPAMAGESHTFVVRDPGSSTDRTVTVTSADIAPEPVNRTEIINTSTGKVGYMLFNTFSPFEAERSLADAFEMLSDENIDDLVLDLRYNGGGLVAIAAQLGFMIAGPSRTAGRTASLLQYNEAAGNRNPITGDVVQPFPFFDEGLGFTVDRGTPLDTVDLPRVFILSTEGTCSASELVINSLLGIDYEVVLIGDTTCGKPYGFLPTDNCGRTYYTIQFQSVNDKGIGDYSDGFSPIDSTNQFSTKLTGCTVGDDLDNELGNESEALLAAALSYRETGSCPTTSAQAKTSAPASSKLYIRSGDAGGVNVLDDPYEINANSYLDATLPGGR